jgi:hypothetical protein
VWRRGVVGELLPRSDQRDHASTFATSTILPRPDIFELFYYYPLFLCFTREDRSPIDDDDEAPQLPSPTGSFNRVVFAAVRSNCTANLPGLGNDLLIAHRCGGCSLQ